MEEMEQRIDPFSSFIFGPLRLWWTNGLHVDGRHLVENYAAAGVPRPPIALGINMRP